jgi:hypothetical protein
MAARARKKWYAGSIRGLVRLAGGRSIRSRSMGYFSTVAVDKDVHGLSKASLSSNRAMPFASALKSYAARKYR